MDRVINLYKVCIFDLDGTLANTLKSIADFANGALTRCGLRTIPVEDYRYLVGNGVDRLTHRMMETVCGADGYREEDVNKLKNIYNQLYEADPTHMIEQYDGMRETVLKLKEMGLRLAVLSNKPHNCTTAVVNFLFPKGTFDLCFGQQPGIARKPSPEGALLIADRLGAEPQECLYIGDTNTDMLTGGAAGMDTAGALWGFRTRRELEENHAKYILQEPGEILNLVACSMR
jgi:haloacid dehalogenase superfamily, subfamily IA, variant 3 with third motif having DD or ED/haloacid dehalogenase superfamily, subfamily IA, variant 1 with third motif having Dx(3-4)D or Dx(3-4)E